MSLRRIALLALPVLVVACGAAGGSGKSAPPAAAPASAPARVEVLAPGDATRGAQAAPEPPPSATSTSSSADMAPTVPAPQSPVVAPDASGRAASLRAARAELVAAERDLEVGAGDCAHACRALASMARATAHLCDLADGGDDRRRCDDAKQKLADARERIQRTCRGC